MNCPLCVDEVLDVTHHGGIEIDVCPRCRGIWLDRGELDRLLGPAEPVARSAPSHAGARNDEYGEFDEIGGSATKGSDRDRKKNKKRRLMDKLGDALEEVLDL